jgi:hypothetical protein
MVVFDTTFLTLMFIPGALHSLPDAKERVEFLIKDIHGRGEKVLVPTPALAEILIKSGKARNQILQELIKAAKFEIAPFDLRAALELSLLSDAPFTSKDKRSGATGTWVKVKFDRQIVAIAKVSGASKIYSEDLDVRNIAIREKLAALSVADIKVPKPDQGDFWRVQ